jgi:hypothetical protein
VCVCTWLVFDGMDYGYIGGVERKDLTTTLQDLVTSMFFESNNVIINDGSSLMTPTHDERPRRNPSIHSSSSSSSSSLPSAFSATAPKEPSSPSSKV